MKLKIILLLVAIVVAGLVHWLMRPTADPLDHFPHTFLAQPGYDPAAVTVVMGTLSQPPPAPEGMAPAWYCDVPPFVDPQGRPWLFPLSANGTARPQPPKHPQLHVAPPLNSCKPFQTADGARLLAAFKAGFQP